MASPLFSPHHSAGDECLGVSVAVQLEDSKQAPRLPNKPPPLFPGARSMTSFSFRFASRFPLSIPVFVTVAPVSCCGGPYLAVTATVW